MSHPDVSGEWSIFQSGGLELHLKVIDDGGTLSGSARYEAEADESTDEAFVDFVIWPYPLCQRPLHGGARNGERSLLRVRYRLEQRRKRQVHGSLPRGRDPGRYRDRPREHRSPQRQRGVRDRVFMLPVAEPVSRTDGRRSFCSIDLLSRHKAKPLEATSRGPTDDGIKEAPRGDLM